MFVPPVGQVAPSEGASAGHRRPLFDPIMLQIGTSNRNHHMMLKVVPREPARDTSAMSDGNGLYYSLCYICTGFLYIREWRPYSTGLGGMSSLSRCRNVAPEQRRR